MSKSILNTRVKILNQALKMFNEQGIEYVGLRELASVLEIRVSNITYYFPTKDDLVYALSLELSRTNAELLVERENLSMLVFLQTFHQVFKNHVRFRCLLLSVVHLMKQNKHMAASYRNTQKTRNATIKSNLQTLVHGGYLTITDNAGADFLVSGISLVSRFWISEAAVSFRGLSTAQQIRHYLALVTKLLMPYATAKGKKDIRVFLEELP